MGNKLFIGGLSFDTNEPGLRVAFERFGEVIEAKIINDRDTGRSRGFGFVTFADGEGARKAIAEMNGATLDGRALKVNEAEERNFGGGDRGGGRDRRSGGRSRY